MKPNLSEMYIGLTYSYTR